MNARTLALVCVAGALLAGCATEPQIRQGDVSAMATDDSAGYIDRLYSQDRVSQDEAFAGMLLMLDGAAPQQDFAARVRALADRDVVDPAWTFDPDAPLTKGQAAYMAYQAGGFPGGLTLTLVGPTQRYALRELQYQGIMSNGVFYTDVTGMEYAGLLTRTDAYRRTGDVPEVLKR